MNLLRAHFDPSGERNTTLHRMVTHNNYFHFYSLVDYLYRMCGRNFRRNTFGNSEIHHCWQPTILIPSNLLQLGLRFNSVQLKWMFRLHTPCFPLHALKGNGSPVFISGINSVSIAWFGQHKQSAVLFFLAACHTNPSSDIVLVQKMPRKSRPENDLFIWMTHPTYECVWKCH